MTRWRPAAAIRVKVVGLAWRGSRLLATEVLTDAGDVYGVCPVGGAVEFGETREQALEREFQEELGCGVTIVGPWVVFENLYEHEGSPGHEFVFAANVQLKDASYYERDEVQLVESDGSVWTARWFLPFELPHGVALFPDGLADQLAALTVESIA